MTTVAEGRSSTAPIIVSDSNSIISLQRVSKRFPVRQRWRDIVLHPFRRESVTVLQSVTCEIAAGEFFGLLGPNGAGKTTLFKILATLIRPDEGTAIVAGYDVEREPAAVRRVLAPVVASERSLLWRVSARENLRLYAALEGIPHRAAAHRVDELLEQVELGHTGDQMVGEFSSGMKQRLLIARALISAPRVLLLDEPTRSLDPISAQRLRVFLREEIVDRRGCTVLLATHTAEEAFQLCDRVGILDRGRLLAVGAADVLSREVGEERYRLWTTAPDHGSLAALVERGIAAQLSTGTPDEDGWWPVDIEVPGGAERTADVIAFLAESNVPIARFERVQLSLADLIERVVSHRGRGGTDG